MFIYNIDYFRCLSSVQQYSTIFFILFFYFEVLFLKSFIIIFSYFFCFVLLKIFNKFLCKFILLNVYQHRKFVTFFFTLIYNTFLYIVVRTILKNALLSCLSRNLLSPLGNGSCRYKFVV